MAIDQVSEDSDLSTNFPFTIKPMMRSSYRFVGSESSAASDYPCVLPSAFTAPGFHSASSRYLSDGSKQLKPDIRKSTYRWHVSM